MQSQKIPWLKNRQIHMILTSLSPKREINSPKLGNRRIPRGISPKAVDYVTQYLNEHLEHIAEALEEALEEVNNNPNSYYLQHRYDLKVIKRAIEIFEGE